MNKWVMAACCAIGLASMSAGAEIYKWKDASGKMHYSDTPPTSRVPFTTLSGKKPAALPDSSAPAPSADKSAKPIEGAPSVAQPVPTKPAEAKPKEGAPSVDPKDAEAQKKAQEEKAAKEAELKRLQEEKLAAEKQIKEQNCRNARARAATYQQGGRIYTVDPNGERHYVGDQEMQEQLEQARADIESNCNN
jgi:type IV secretory pathway VirB10-like protein